MTARLMSRYLSDDGTPTGVKDMSTTADEYFLKDASATLLISRLIVSYRDGGGGTVSEYGNLNAALTNGILVQVRGRDGVTVKQDLLDGEPVKTNGDWARFCYDANRLDWGSGDDYFVVRWTLAKSGEALTLEPGQRLSMIIQDDLTNLTEHYCLAQGIRK